MSSPDGALPTRRAVLAAGLAGAALALAGCGFQPVYGTGPARPGIGGALAGIEVKEFEGRVGQQVRNALVFLLYGGGAPGPAAYRLEGETRVDTQALILEPTGRRTSISLDVIVDYRLVRLSDGETVSRGRSVRAASYDRSGQSFANLRARRDAEDRAAEQVAEDLWARLAGALAAGT